MVTYGLPVVYMLIKISFDKVILKRLFNKVILNTQVFIYSIGMAGKLC